MNRIPVGRSIAFAYAYMFHHIGAVVRVTWFPALIFVVADAVTRISAAGSGSAVNEIEQAGGNAPIVVIGALVMLVARSQAAVSITRQVLGQPNSAIPMDATTLRMIAANLRFFIGGAVLLVTASLISVGAFALAGVPLDMPEAAEASIAAMIAAVLSLSLFAYAAIAIIRMGFFLAAVVVAEDKSGLKRSHDLAMGNLWRMIAVLAALGLPIVFLLAVGEFLVLSSALGPDFLSREDTAAVMRQAEGAIRDQIVAWEIFNAMLFVLASGLIYSGFAYAYRSVVLETPTTPSPPVSG